MHATHIYSIAIKSLPTPSWIKHYYSVFQNIVVLAINHFMQIFIKYAILSISTLADYTRPSFF